MIDREKVIKDLKRCVLPHGNGCTPECEYHGRIECCRQVMRNALALLKAQDSVEPKVVDTSSSKLYHSDMFKNYYCGNCGEFLHVVNRKDLFCSQCGRKVKWNG